MTDIEINEDFKKALDLAECLNKNLFITGRAGTGKSTLLKYFREHTQKKIAVIAPTGVAAVNIGGQTVHSFFGFRPDITVNKVERDYKKVRKAKLYAQLDALVIDEISMVRADLLDCVNTFLKMHGRVKGKPFGGIQMIFFGDLYQLPPVVTSSEKEIFEDVYKSPYFFNANVMNEITLEIVELNKIYRQKDGTFIDILNSVRNKSIADNLGFSRYEFWTWDKRARIYIYDDTQDYQEKTGKPAWSGGHAYYHEKVIETYPWAGGFFDSLLPHELGHIIFREFIGTQNNAPVWLDEGVAMYQEKNRRKDIKPTLLQAIEEKKFMSLEKLSQLNIGFVEDKSVVELYYNESVNVVEYLISRFGKDNFVKLCKALKERKNFEQAVTEAYRVFKNLEDLNKNWLKYIKE